MNFLLPNKIEIWQTTIKHNVFESSQTTHCRNYDERIKPSILCQQVNVNNDDRLLALIIQARNNDDPVTPDRYGHACSVRTPAEAYAQLNQSPATSSQPCASHVFFIAFEHVHQSWPQSTSIARIDDACKRLTDYGARWDTKSLMKALRRKPWGIENTPDSRPTDENFLQFTLAYGVRITKCFLILCHLVARSIRLFDWHT